MYLGRLLLTQFTLPEICTKYLKEQKFQWIGKITSSKAGCAPMGSLVATVPGRYIPVCNGRLSPQGNSAIYNVASVISS